MNILIVEDEANLAESVKEILSSQKIYCDIVYDGADGLDYALSGIYDVILLDIMLPKLNGFEVLGKLRANKINTPVILLTARDQISDKVKGRRRCRRLFNQTHRPTSCARIGRFRQG